jgi:hypothetical protein
MANIDAPDLNRAYVPSGTWGVQSLIDAHVTVPADAASGDVVRLAKLQRGTLIVDAKITTPGGGASGSSADIGLAAVHDGEKGDDAYFTGGADTASAGATRSDCAPLKLDDDDYYVTATLGATAPGADVELHVVVFYQYEGI